jgi:prephenate dehydratase
VQSGSVDRGVVPVENSTNGPVYQTLDLFADRKAEHSDVRVRGDAFVPVHHCLLGHRQKPEKPEESGKNETRHDTDYDYSHIKILYTHPQAWTQCTPFLTKYLSHAEKQDCSSTSKGAELAAADKTGASASISSNLAEEIYDLDMLAEGIEELSGNTTRFLILTNSANFQDAQADAENQTSPPRCKTLISFTISHTDPGALARALSVFGKHNINLTSINARPSGEHSWHYIFFVEFWGVWYPADMGMKVEDEVAAAMTELGSVVEGWKWIGCWRSTGNGNGGPK